MAESPNYMAMFLQGQQAGQQQRQFKQRQNALAMYGTDPKGAENALMAAGDVETANALTQRRQAQTRIDTEQATVKRRQEVGSLAATDPGAARNAALQAGDMDLAAEVGKLDDAKKAALAKANAQVGGIAYHLLQEKDPQARQQLAAAAIPILKQQGVLPQDAEVDLSDAGLQTYVSQAMELKDVLAQGNADRTFKMTQANLEADNKRADMTASEAARHNRAAEGTAAFSARDASARGWAGVGVSRAAEARAASSAKQPGAGKPPTEDQAKTGFNVSRMKGASQELNSLEGTKGFNATMVGTASALARPDARRYQSAKQEWSDALIRQTTGAAATKQEIEAVDKAYFPQFGDDASVVRYKAGRRAQAEASGATRAAGQRQGGQDPQADPLGIR